MLEFYKTFKSDHIEVIIGLALPIAALFGLILLLNDFRLFKKRNERLGIKNEKYDIVKVILIVLILTYIEGALALMNMLICLASCSDLDSIFSEIGALSGLVSLLSTFIIIPLTTRRENVGDIFYVFSFLSLLPIITLLSVFIFRYYN